jgi:hypothetical protein
MLERKLLLRVSDENGALILTETVDVEADGGSPRSIEMPAETTDEEVEFNVVAAGMEMIYITSDVDVTIKTNDTVAPDDTFELVAGKPLCWYKDSQLPCPFTVDVTVLYITNAGSVAGTVEIDSLHDVTP